MFGWVGGDPWFDRGMTEEQLRDRAGQMRALNEQGKYQEAQALWPAPAPGDQLAWREGVDAAYAVSLQKDGSRRFLERLEKAREVLAPHLPEGVARDPDTLGTAGGVVRRFFEIDLRPEHLREALDLYQRGHELDEKSGWKNLGYPGINAAFITDQLAALEGDGQIRERSAVADGIRRTLIEQLPKKGERGYWVLATLAEAHFGLREYDAARPFLEEAVRQKPVEWMRETTGRQLALLARLQEGKVIPKAAVDALGVLFEGRPEGLWSAVIGKLGLALSGGGFRASLFHIGVLMRLAELDLLRHVEVISTVSGGSILGALYYLELRKALGEQGDPEIDYVKVVAEVRRRFLEGLQSDLRNRIFFDVVENWRMLSGKRSRTEIAADLYERYFYSGYVEGDALRMSGLGAGDARQNYWKRNKRPKLILNAATLNTGHAWQFTVEEMGEPPPVIAEDLDVNDRFERQKYAAFDQPAREVSLGVAVGASACVPGIFEPIELKGAYPAHRLRLVDGGVHDNQGVRALLDQDCTAIIASDASGQMGFKEQSPVDALGTVLRSNSIFQARIREAQYADLRSRRRGNLLRYLRLVHLKQDFQPRTILPGPAAVAAPEAQPLGYGFSPEVQQRLAGLRTDLDAFSEAECELLIASGYAMVGKYVLPEELGAPPPPKQSTATPPLPGLKLAAPGPAFRKDGWEALLRHLDVGSSVMGKSIQASPWVKRAAQGLGLVIAGLAVWWVKENWDQPLSQMTVGALVVAVAMLLFKRAVPLAEPVIDLKHGEFPLWHLVKRGGLAVAMAVGSRGASWLVGRTFLRRGRVKEFTS